MFLPQEIIRRKRDGNELDADSLKAFCQEVATGSITEGQLGAFAMAVYLQGMSAKECVALTLAMRDSGHVISWDQDALDGPVVDKHSTGGVGDGVSLVLGPMLAACGAYVPMISGRGLGHTGGTLDKLESIPKYQITPDEARFRKTVREVGVAIVGQSTDLAPADGALYAVRDVTATVASLPLITASILSKKLAAGLQGLVMDVKVGSGAFMPTNADSQALAKSIVSVANEAGLPTKAVMTNMDACLSANAGNALEIRDAIAYLRGERPSQRFHQVVMALGTELLLLGGMKNPEQRLKQSLSSGTALEIFAKMVAALGGPNDFLERADRYLPKAPVTRGIEAVEQGVVSTIDVRALGILVVELGGGRLKPNAPIDHAVGLENVITPGQKVDAGDVLATVHARTDDDANLAAATLREAITIGEEPPFTLPVIHGTFGD